MKSFTWMPFALAVTLSVVITGCSGSEAKVEQTYKSDSQVIMDNMKKEIDVSKDADSIIESVKQ